MWSAVQKTAPQIALRGSSKEVWGKDSVYICDFAEGGIHAIRASQVVTQR